MSETENTLKGIIFDIRKYSVHDGPGIRTTIFFKGCPLRCLWCHNPEGLEQTVEITFRNDRCIRCGSCVPVCKQKAISWINDAPFTDGDLCIRCGTCADTCYAEARETVGKEMTVDQVMADIEGDIPFYDESGGGVTLSGGEPLLQASFTHVLLETCKRKDIHTAIDTCGFANWEVLKKVCESTDLILYDVKLINEEKHQEYTGVSNDIILRNLQKLSRLGHNIVIRVPVIPGINDDNENMRQIGSFAAALPHLNFIELLPYNELGIHKYHRFLKRFKLSDIQSPSRERMSEIINTLTNFGITVTSRN